MDWRPKHRRKNYKMNRRKYKRTFSWGKKEF